MSDTTYSASATLKRGRPIARSEVDALVYKEIYIDLSYQIDIWSDRLYEVDTILQETLLYFAEEPYLEIEEDNVEHTYTIPFRVTDVICTNTDLSSFNDVGALYRQTLVIEAEGVPLIFPRRSLLALSIPIRVVTINSRGEEDEDSL